jgi:N-formylglutamate deformylase
LSTDLLHPVPWEVRTSPGPVVIAAIHAGHDIRPELREWLAVPDEERRREEDPLTDYWLPLGDSTIRVNRSRFEVDLNRPRERAVATEPADTWGMRIWKRPPPAPQVDTSLALHDRFYGCVSRLLDQLVESCGNVLVLDVHSYNHRRDDATRQADPAHNPDIDLGTTTLDRSRFGHLSHRFAEALSQGTLHGHRLDVRENVKYPGGGHFPEWIYQHYGHAVCTISVEYKKTFMDEWTSTADIAAMQSLRTALAHAVHIARAELPGCRC